MPGFDIAIIGAGPAGAATALALARRGYLVALLEQSNYDLPRVGETLPPSIRKLLVQLGVWERFLQQNHSPAFGVRSIWGRDETYSNDFIFNPYGAGWHVTRPAFDSMLTLAARDAGAKIHMGARLRTCVRDPAGAWLLDGVNLRAKFLVDATGRNSSIARRLGARRRKCDRLIGVAGFFASESGARDSFTLIESIETGWWYSAQLPDRKLVAAFMTDADLRRDWKDMLGLAPHTAARLDRHTLTGDLLLRSAESSILEPAAGDRWLAVGDAASAFDPLSSQGIYAALDSGLCAAAAIDSHFKGDTAACAAYAASVGHHFDKYLQTQATYYNRELRWPDSPFWKRRVTRVPSTRKPYPNNNLPHLSPTP